MYERVAQYSTAQEILVLLLREMHLYGGWMARTQGEIRLSDWLGWGKLRLGVEGWLLVLKDCCVKYLLLLLQYLTYIYTAPYIHTYRKVQ